ncbi:hypothetical protein GIB67_006164 [Kingdonia uniflora]|uniref:Uncharacterized protein n=1 Tax=Kingdonia uniflora TaxID=39325 RepID=A0A7J7LQ55_9MAGN|nr:hypothetical protein GIB67_006164 [Kingdonia uniflora]
MHFRFTIPVFQNRILFWSNRKLRFFYWAFNGSAPNTKKPNWALNGSTPSIY